MGKLLFYGCSMWLGATLEKFEIDYSRIDFADSKEELWGRKFLDEKKILSPEKIKIMDYSYAIVGSKRFSKEIEEKLINLGFTKRQIVPYEYLNSLWERWKKTDTFKLWKKKQNNQHISIIQNWFMEGTNASCIINVNKLLGYELVISCVDIYKQSRIIEVCELAHNQLLESMSSKEQCTIQIWNQSALYKITVKNGIIGVPWIDFGFHESAWLKETEKLKLSKQFLDIYSNSMRFPYYDEDYTVIERMKDEKGTILDIGANYGQSMFAFYNMVKSKIISFEVQPDLYEVLLSLKKLIDRENRIEIVNSGISCKEEELIWYEPDNPYICGSFDSEFILNRKLDVKINQSVMKCNTLDELVKNYTDIWFIKMDVEGLEFEALQGAKKIIEHNYPLILIEQNEKLEDIKKLLESKYEIFYYDIQEDCFKKNRVSRLNCWFIPKAQYRKERVKQVIKGRMPNEK